MTRVNFYCIGSYVGVISGPQQVSFWSSDPLATRFSTYLLIPVDLSMTPSAARSHAIGIDQIQCDDNRQAGGLTGIGPLFPGGAMIGSCWLNERYLDTLGGNAPERFNPTEEYAYESLMTMYFDGELGDRTFNGFHAQLVSTAGNLSLVDIWNGGTAKSGAPPAGRWWLDLAAVTDPNETKVSPANPSGPLFLDRQVRQSVHLRDTKRPPGWGTEGIGED